MNRRGFLAGILALGAAPAIVRADSLMRVVARDTVVFQRIDPFDIYVDPAYGGDETVATLAELRNGQVGIVEQFRIYQGGPEFGVVAAAQKDQRTANAIARMIADRLEMAANPPLVVGLRQQLEQHLRDSVVHGTGVGKYSMRKVHLSRSQLLEDLKRPWVPDADHS